MKFKITLPSLLNEANVDLIKHQTMFFLRVKKRNKKLWKDWKGQFSLYVLKIACSGLVAWQECQQTKRLVL
jgi:hypothetical protein